MTPLLDFRFEVDVVQDFLFDERIMHGAWVTLQVSLYAQLLGIALGVLFALMRLSKNPLLNGPANFYIWFMRGTPAVLQLFMLQFGVTSLIAEPDVSREFTFFRVAIVALGLNEGAYMAEIVRAGILSVESGQMDAAKSVGMRYLQAMRRVVLPQASRVVIPPTGNEFIAMLKNSSVASFIGLQELFRETRLIYADNFRIMEMLMVAAFWYLLMATVFSIFQAELERRLGLSDAGTPRTFLGRVFTLVGSRRVA